MDCKAMATPMASNLKLLSDASSETVDAMMYHQMIGSLMYLTNMRPGIFFAVNTLSQFLTCSLDCLVSYSRHVHLIAANHILRYLKGIVDYGLQYETNQNINMEGYVDSDWAGSAINRKSTSRCYFSIGSSVISWFGMMDSCMALSTTEEKYVATCYLGGSMFILKTTI